MMPLNLLKRYFSPRALEHELEERVPVGPVMEVASHKTVPIHRHSYWYYMGGISLFLFVVQLVSGILLLFHYQPGAESSHASVLRIMTKVDFGWLIRSIHSWGANLMVFFVFVHMFSAFLMKAYQKPRELTWWTGIVLLLLTITFGFTGYLLPWDEVSYFATKIGMDTPVNVAKEAGEMVEKLIPVAGKPLSEAMLWGAKQGPFLLKGGEEITGLTIQRFFTLHVVILPWVFIGVLTVHLILVQIHGNRVPKAIEESKAYRRVPFFPNFFYADLFMWLLTFNLLSTLAALSPWPLGPEADPIAAAPAGIHPEWYFMAQFQILKMLPELVAIGLFTAGFMLWALVPIWDPATTTGRRAKIATYAGILAVAGLILFTLWGYAGLHA
ncbi:MAG: cytochrome bc complex cytochrome b subunit [Planctomycetes bacterium]|nr:cytochrome bc complex cytochrome b subunit [Planctomycetota bacterium]